MKRNYFGVTTQLKKTFFIIALGISVIAIAALSTLVNCDRALSFFTSDVRLNNSAIIISIILLVAAIVSLCWYRLITGAIRHFSIAVKRIGRGNLNVNTKIMSCFVFGELCDAFQQIADHLKEKESNLKESEIALAQAEKLAAFGQIGAGIAHEIQNPITGILGLAQVCLRQEDCKAPLAQNLNAIEKEAKRCKLIVDNLLRFARQEEISTSDVAVEKLIQDTLTITADQFQKKGIEIETMLSDKLPMIHGNAVQLQQVLRNIIINALQSIGNGPGSVRITASSPKRGRLELRIADTGPGMPESSCSKIFEPFYTTRPIGQGTGLGLWVTQVIIKAHKGSIDVESTGNMGAEFIITLPAAHK